MHKFATDGKKQGRKLSEISKMILTIIHKLPFTIIKYECDTEIAIYINIARSKEKTFT